MSRFEKKNIYIYIYCFSSGDLSEAAVDKGNKFEE